MENTNTYKEKEVLNVTFPNHYHLNTFSILPGVWMPNEW